jgi:hypothetical protein
MSQRSLEISEAHEREVGTRSIAGERLQVGPASVFGAPLVPPDVAEQAPERTGEGAMPPQAANLLCGLGVSTLLPQPLGLLRRTARTLPRRRVPSRTRTTDPDAWHDAARIATVRGDVERS